MSRRYFDTNQKTSRTTEEDNEGNRLLRVYINQNPEASAQMLRKPSYMEEHSLDNVLAEGSPPEAFARLDTPIEEIEPIEQRHEASYPGVSNFNFHQTNNSRRNFDAYKSNQDNQKTQNRRGQNKIYQVGPAAEMMNRDLRNQPTFTSFPNRNLAYERQSPPPVNKTTSTRQQSSQPDLSLRSVSSVLPVAAEPSESRNDLGSSTRATNPQIRDSSSSDEEESIAEVEIVDRLPITQSNNQLKHRFQPHKIDDSESQINDSNSQTDRENRPERHPFKRLVLLSNTVAVERINMSGVTMPYGRPTGIVCEGVIVDIASGSNDLLEIGDRVMLPSEQGMSFTQNGVTYELFRSSEILARFSD